VDLHRLGQVVAIFRAGKQAQERVLAVKQPAKGGKAGAVRITSAPFVQFRLVAEADKEARTCRSRLPARHRKRSIDMGQAGLRCRLMRNGREWRFQLVLAWTPAPLDDLDLVLKVSRLVLHRDDP